MAYPEKGATYRHTPKFLDRMKEGEGQREDLRPGEGRTMDRTNPFHPEDPIWPETRPGKDGDIDADDVGRLAGRLVDNMDDKPKED